MGNLDKDFWSHVDGVENNSFINILHVDTDDDDNSDQPQIMSHSPYYVTDNLISTLTQNKNNFSILSTNIQSLRAMFDDLNIFIEQLRTLNFGFSVHMYVFYQIMIKI